MQLFPCECPAERYISVTLLLKSEKTIEYGNYQTE